MAAGDGFKLWNTLKIGSPSNFSSQKNKILLGGSSIYATSLITLIIILGQNFDSLGLASAFTISQIISMTYFMCANHFLKNC